MLSLIFFCSRGGLLRISVDLIVNRRDALARNHSMQASTDELITVSEVASDSHAFFVKMDNVNVSPGYPGYAILIGVNREDAPISARTAGDSRGVAPKRP